MSRTSPPVPETRDDVENLAVLKPGDTGDAIRIIQQRLLALGFSPGPIDGHYGDLTALAVKRFQQSASLPPTGLVDNRTLHALGYEVDPSPPAGDERFSVEAVSPMFPGAPPHNIRAYLPLVLGALAEVGLDDPSMTLAALATIRAETGSFAPIDEYPSKYNTAPGGAPFALYDFRRDLGNNAVGDGARYKGRGFIQLTGRDNYRTFSDKLGLDTLLLDRPDMANDPWIAARVLAAFLKSKESIIRKALERGDFTTARKAVNGGTHGLEQFIASYRTGAREVGLA
jgi:peptidoglycan L-alanyl-D-glutamate endopeptidase CwlK